MKDRGKMKRRWMLSVLSVGLLFLLGCDGQKGTDPSGTAIENQGDRPEFRLVSLAPSLTEMIFALGVGDSLVADTNYCVTPEEARALPKVGSWTDVNVEQVLSFKPTHICLTETHPKRRQFESLGAGVVAVKGQTLSDVLASIGQLGEAFGREERARELVSGIRERMAALRGKQAGKKRLRGLVMISRVRGEGKLQDMIVAGDDGYFSELLALAGCEQVPQGLGVPYPSMSMEGIASLNPDVIIEIAPELSKERTPGVERTQRDWLVNLPELRAVKTGRILVFTENWATVPGLRSVLFAEKLAQRLGETEEKRP